MSQFLTIVLIAAFVVALFMLGLSITLIRKGHHIKSEISENENMRKLGIKCAAQQMREEEAALRGDPFSAGDCSAGCGDCRIPDDKKCNT